MSIPEVERAAPDYLQHREVKSAPSSLSPLTHLYAALILAYAHPCELR